MITSRRRKQEMWLKAPIPAIYDYDDCRAVKKDCKRKISDITLRYMLNRRIIKRHLFAGYKASNPCPKSRILTEKNIIDDVNNKLIEVYKSA